jgi:hypothetical protein
MRDFLFVSCTAGHKEETVLYRSLEKLLIHDYFFFENNRRGLPACYNEYLEKLAGTDRILVLVHSDVTIADIFVREKVDEATKTFNVVGLVGSSTFNFGLQTPHYAWPVWPRECLSGSVEHVVGNGMTDWYHFGPTPRRCVVMDGLFLAIDMVKIGSVRFDPRFTFHLYDIDFCLSAHYANLTLGTANVYVQHGSVGNFSAAAYQQAMWEFRTKWSADPRNKSLRQQ